MADGDAVFVDYADRGDLPRLAICGVSVAERVLRAAASNGATRAIIRADAGQLPALPVLPLTVELIAPGAAVPEIPSIAGNVIAGVAITDARTRRTAARALLQSCRRSYDGLGDKYVIRSVSLPLSALWCRLGITPNQITIVNILVGIAACVLVPLGSYTGFAIAGGLMFVQVVLDSCDGEVARLRFLSSKFGMWLDNVSDDVIDNVFLAMLALGVGGVWTWIGIAAAVLRSWCALMIHLDVARAGRPGDIMSFTWFFDTGGEDLGDRFETGKPSVMSLVRSAGRRDFYILVWTATCLAGVPVVGLVLGIAVSLGYFGLGAAHVILRRRST
ncbi:MAG: CDP-alcohol phosphatidyltransferase family protein [Deltaproteobacteria bacterium]|nr:CDP-alcohol phosphatidyltransferase family protein [Deltaproteobacteria bacterium]